ncbi:MAG: UDP-N-acetylmuramate:L-alanyl-gamma-D-glutamyl-meso-diaminopimelate ligase [Francisellaceae bacterium]|jgi:UDP-N-acetylmuramate: L-alanyl-gamma-D-glutamyl-meso-diaminopimelate ligase|nr:UDP-N-acetylmuramate:L-alanyl-gamma-D-glutamyl-meso-diaminopimelate ligase [Francisellaceae bacterium]
MGLKGIVHILGIGGTLMASIALLAKEAGFSVSGQDKLVKPPMLDLLQNNNIDFEVGYDVKHIPADTSLVIVGNVMRRGMPIIEHLIEMNIDYTSGADFLHKYILKNKTVIAVAGTHGKTSTASMIAWILECSGYKPGFLIGGAPNNFPVSARLGGGKYFVIEADEYDTAFFDKRPKFLHYYPDFLLINNIEFDHADIYRDLDAILLQFHYLIRSVKPSSFVIFPEHNKNISKVIDMGLWSKSKKFTCTKFKIQQIGMHYQHNASAAYAVAEAVGVTGSVITQALESFQGVKRRQELKYCQLGIKIYDDFAHHPSAINANIVAFKQEPNTDRVIIVLNFSSNTMVLGVQEHEFVDALADANEVFFLHDGNISWPIDDCWLKLNKHGGVFSLSEKDQLEGDLANTLRQGDTLVIMSNSVLNITDAIISNLQATVTG